MLAELMRLKQGIAIAGTHGKTTTTSLVASVLAEAGARPDLRDRRPAQQRRRQLRGSARATTSWSRPTSRDASFLNLLPVMAVVTNIDADHMETYGHDFAQAEAGLRRVPAPHAVLRRGDPVHRRPGVRAILPMISRPIISYGFGEDAQVRAVDVRAVGGADALHRAAPQRRAAARPATSCSTCRASTTCSTRWRRSRWRPSSSCPTRRCVKALAEFTGVGRRFQRYGELPAADGGHFTLIDDYGHHPVEMAATLAAARGAFPGRRLVLAFQPHRYTRTRDCFEDFVKVIGSADAVLLAEVYAAGEAPIVAADGRALARALRVAGKVEPVFVDDIAEHAAGHRSSSARDGDVVHRAWAPARSARCRRKVVETAERSRGMKAWRMSQSTSKAWARSPC